MTTLSSQPMSLRRVEFNELFARHLCRHSQLGINIAHLIALIGIWYSVYALLFLLTRTPWAPIGLAIAYFAVLVPNMPPRVLLATAAFLGLFLLAVLRVPLLPLWACWGYLLLIVACYEVQSVSHKIFTVSKDMTEFDRKYKKGRTRFIILLLYEVPMSLNYLLFERPVPVSGPAALGESTAIDR